MLVIVHVLLQWLNRLHWILHSNEPDVSVKSGFSALQHKHDVVLHVIPDQANRVTGSSNSVCLFLGLYFSSVTKCTQFPLNSRLFINRGGISGTSGISNPQLWVIYVLNSAYSWRLSSF